MFMCTYTYTRNVPFQYNLRLQAPSSSFLQPHSISSVHRCNLHRLNVEEKTTIWCILIIENKETFCHTFIPGLIVFRRDDEVHMKKRRKKKINGTKQSLICWPIVCGAFLPTIWHAIKVANGSKNKTWKKNTLFKIVSIRQNKKKRANNDVHKTASFRPYAFMSNLLATP